MLDITVFDGVHNTNKLDEKYSWEGICDLFEDASQKHWGRGDKLKHLAYIPGRLSGPRSAANVVHISFGSYDIDVAGTHPDYIDFPTMRSKLDAMGVAYVLATSTKSLVTDHRYRLMLRFEQPVPVEHHASMWHHTLASGCSIFSGSTSGVILTFEK